MKVIEWLAVAVLLAAPIARAELAPVPALNAACAVERADVEAAIAARSAQIAAELAHEIEARVAARLTQYWAQTDAAPQHGETLVAIAD